jgi:hypothetical protein
LRSAGGFGRKIIAKIASYTERIKKIHTNIVVLKLPLLARLQQNIGEIGHSIASCPSIIILEKTLN